MLFCNVEALEQFDGVSVGVFADLADGEEAVSVVNAEKRAERDICADLFEVDLTAVSGKFREEVRERYLGKMCEERFRRQEECGAFFGRHGFECFEGIGVFEDEAARFCADERGHRAAASELCADVCAERADISSFGTMYAHLVICAVSVDIECMDCDGTRFALDGDAASCEIDELFAADLEGAVHGRDLHDLSDEGVCRADDGVFVGDILVFDEDIACDVFRVGRDAEAETGYVFFVLFRQKFGCFDGSSDEDGQKPCGDRVERSRVSDLFCAVQSADACNDIKGRDAVRLVDEKYAVIHRSHIPL